MPRPNSAPDQVWRFENTTPPHFKYYLMEAWRMNLPAGSPARYFVITTHGRMTGHGGNGTRTVQEHANVGQGFINEKIDTRISHGYNSAPVLLSNGPVELPRGTTQTGQTVSAPVTAHTLPGGNVQVVTQSQNSSRIYVPAPKLTLQEIDAWLTKLVPSWVDRRATITTQVAYQEIAGQEKTKDVDFGLVRGRLDSYFERSLTHIYKRQPGPPINGRKTYRYDPDPTSKAWASAAGLDLAHEIQIVTQAWRSARQPFTVAQVCVAIRAKLGDEVWFSNGSVKNTLSSLCDSAWKASYEYSAEPNSDTWAYDRQHLTPRPAPPTRADLIDL